jgi:hypothetical protein
MGATVGNAKNQRISAARGLRPRGRASLSRIGRRGKFAICGRDRGLKRWRVKGVKTLIQKRSGGVVPSRRIRDGFPPLLFGRGSPRCHVLMIHARA